jgi:hypothetical protein
VIDKEQAWFWTAEWQAAERQAEEDLRAGQDIRITVGCTPSAEIQESQDGPHDRNVLRNGGRHDRTFKNL